jgi:hypothetical protein
MSAEYDAGYKQGVVDGLDFPLPFIGTYSATFLLEMVEEQRKKLLTKKVTKYVAVTLHPISGKPYARGYFQDTKEEALAYKTPIPNDSLFVGVFPIEIETQL